MEVSRYHNPTPRSVLFNSTSNLGLSFKIGYTSAINQEASSWLRRSVVELLQKRFILAYSKYLSARAISFNIRSFVSFVVQHKRHTPLKYFAISADVICDGIPLFHCWRRVVSNVSTPHRNFTCVG